MGITIRLEGENGDVRASIEDPTNVLHRLLPECGDMRFHCLQYVDRYGDTVFNRPQAPRLIEELGWLVLDRTRAEDVRVVEGIRALAERVRDNVHLYLRFYGD
jgi:hypothetical protein